MLTSQQWEDLGVSCKVKYSRVSSGVGSVSYGHVVVLVPRASDPVESSIGGGEGGGEPALQHHISSLYHVLHRVLVLTVLSWKLFNIRRLNAELSSRISIQPWPVFDPWWVILVANRGVIFDASQPGGTCFESKMTGQNFCLQWLFEQVSETLAGNVNDRGRNNNSSLANSTVWLYAIFLLHMGGVEICRDCWSYLVEDLWTPRWEKWRTEPIGKS